jgi:hypothetical protein
MENCKPKNSPIFVMALKKICENANSLLDFDQIFYLYCRAHHKIIIPNWKPLLLKSCLIDLVFLGRTIWTFLHIGTRENLGLKCQSTI